MTDQRAIIEQLTAYRGLFEALLKRREADCEAYANATPYEQNLWSSKRAQLERLADIDHAQRKINLFDAAMERVVVGQYGSCTCCGVSIDETRLTADPAEPNCTSCARSVALSPRTKQIDAGIACEAMVIRLDDNIAILALPSGEHGSLSLGEIADQPLGQLNEYLRVGDVVRVKSLGNDGSGRARLTMKMSRQVAA
jgi:RNA polymerase-binding transcription factor DksA